MQVPVSFENEGQLISGMIHIPESKGPWPGVVLCHGFTGHKMETHFIFVKLAREMCRKGLAVLRFDFRGSGESEGLFEEMTVQGEISDARAALNFLVDYPGIDIQRIGLLGFSLGGLVSVMAGSADPRVKTMVLWAPAVGFPERFPARFTDLEPDERGRYDLGAFRIGKDLISKISELKPYEEIRRFSGSLLIIHGTDDQSVPYSDSELLLAEAMCRQKRLDLLPGADHAWSSDQNERDIIRRTSEWFKTVLNA